MGSSQSKNKEKKTASQAVEEGVGKYVDVVLGFGEDDIKELEAELKKRKEELKAKTPCDCSKQKKTLLDGYTEDRLHELGLGRGIDSTNSRPWINKTAFQVREAKKAKRDDEEDKGLNLIITDEGGLVNDFFEEVTSITSQSTKLSLSATPVPTAPVTVSTGADMTRKLTTTQTAFGKRVLNKTVAFTPDFDDSEDTLLDNIKELSDEEMNAQNMEALFYAFVKHYRSTHYVSSITLGASKFVVKTESEYVTSLSPNANVGYEPLASVKASATFEKELKKNSKNIQCVGRFKDKTTYDVTQEAVVNVKLEPISSLFKTEQHKLAMESAIRKFIDDQKGKKEGPYIISCNDARIFLKTVVNTQTGHARVYATRNIKEASQFYILLTDCVTNPYEFYIGWKNGEEGAMRYLTAATSVCGRHDGPLCLESRAKKHDSLFSINHRLTNHLYRLSKNENVNPEVWLRGEESFLIRCTRRISRVDGFVAIERTQGGEEFRTVTRGNAEGHDDNNFHMSFRLHFKIPSEDDRTEDSWINIPTRQSQN